MKKLHWTQTPRGRKIAAENARAAAARKRAAMLRKPEQADQAPAPVKRMALAKQELHELAMWGAKEKLMMLEREADKLRIVLGLRARADERT